MLDHLESQEHLDITQLEERGYALLQDGKRVEGERIFHRVAERCLPCMNGKHIPCDDQKCRFNPNYVS